MRDEYAGNLDQLRVFIAVAEQRSFSAVARQQRKAQSAISSAIAMLEDDLGVSLFERSSGRQPRLTEAGEALLEEAREVLRQCERLNGRAMAMMRGQEAQLRVAQDEAMPYQALVESFGALADQFPAWKYNSPALLKAKSHANSSSAAPISACCSITMKSPRRWSDEYWGAWKWSRSAGSIIRWRRRRT